MNGFHNDEFSYGGFLTGIWYSSTDGREQMEEEQAKNRTKLAVIEHGLKLALAAFVTVLIRDRIKPEFLRVLRY